MLFGVKLKIRVYFLNTAIQEYRIISHETIHIKYRASLVQPTILFINYYINKKLIKITIFTHNGIFLIKVPISHSPDIGQLQVHVCPTAFYVKSFEAQRDIND